MLRTKNREIGILYKLALGGIPKNIAQMFKTKEVERLSTETFGGMPDSNRSG